MSLIADVGIDTMNEKESLVQPENGSTSKSETGSESASRWRYGVNVVVAGLFFLFLSLLAALIFYRDTKDATASAAAIATVLAPVTGVIGTIVGAYFGVAAGAASAAKAEQSRDDAEDTALKLAAATSPEAASRIVA